MMKHTISQTEQAIDGGVNDAIAWWEIELGQNGYHEGSYGRRFFNRIKAAALSPTDEVTVEHLSAELNDSVMEWFTGNTDDSQLDFILKKLAEKYTITRRK